MDFYKTPLYSAEMKGFSLVRFHERLIEALLEAFQVKRNCQSFRSEKSLEQCRFYCNLVFTVHNKSPQLLLK